MDTTNQTPKVNIRCECHDGLVHGSTYLNVIRVETEDDGYFTAVTDHWPNCGHKEVLSAYQDLARRIVEADGHHLNEVISEKLAEIAKEAKKLLEGTPK